MHRKIRSLGIILNLLMPFAIFGYAGASSPPGLPPGQQQQLQDPGVRVYEERAEEILAMASEKILGYGSLEMHFEYQADDNISFGDEEEMDAVLYSKGDKYYMRIGKSHFISDGETAWTFLEEVNEVHISLAEFTDQAMTPAYFLQNFKEEFRSKWIREQEYNGRTVHIIDMVPVEPHAFYKYRLALDTGDNHIVYTQAHDRQGNIIHYEITDFITGGDIPDSLFVFNPDNYPGIEVVDLR